MDAVRGFLHDWRLVLLIIHVGVTAAMIVVILLQRSEGGGLGMGGRTDALFSVRGQANVLSRMTAIFATIFFFLSLLMAWSMTDPGRDSDARSWTACRPTPGRARAAPAARRPRRRPGAARRAHPLGTTADVATVPPPKSLRRGDIPMAATNKRLVCCKPMTRFIFITGGVVSSLGKGLSSAALGALLQARGYRVRLRKLDPYLNVDPGTMSPYQHGEVFVTDDGAETDLDLGHYERFTGVDARQSRQHHDGPHLLRP